MKKLIHGGDIYTAKEKGKNLLDFSANINPFGMPEGVRKAAAAALEFCDQYPDPLCRKLTEAVAAYEGVSEKHLLFGNGAADLIFRLAAAVKPKWALVTAPTFAEYENALETVGCSMEYYFLKEEQDFRLGEDFLEAIHPGLEMVFLCNPNNPTGQMIGQELLLKILQRCRAFGVRLVVDECFLDFVEEPETVTMKSYYEEYPELFLLRAFTKNYAMPGIRLGYSICSDQALLEDIFLAGQPWSVSLVAQEAGIAALQEKDFLRKSAVFICEEKKRLAEELERLGYKVFPPSANYILFKVFTRPESLVEDLAERGILIRSCGNYRGLSCGYFRVAVRTAEENRKLIAALTGREEQWRKR